MCMSGTDGSTTLFLGGDKGPLPVLPTIEHLGSAKEEVFTLKFNE